MCVPLGHRNHSSSNRNIKTTITKEEVEYIISHSSYAICQKKDDKEDAYNNYAASMEDLLAILQENTTNVSVANTRRREYKRGYRTIVMEAPSIHATVILRVKKD